MNVTHIRKVTQKLPRKSNAQTWKQVRKNTPIHPKSIVAIRPHASPTFTILEVRSSVYVPRSEDSLTLDRFTCAAENNAVPDICFSNCSYEGLWQADKRWKQLGPFEIYVVINL